MREKAEDAGRHELVVRRAELASEVPRDRLVEDGGDASWPYEAAIVASTPPIGLKYAFAPVWRSSS
jgi:hypothetical protein